MEAYPNVGVNVTAAAENQSSGEVVAEIERANVTGNVTQDLKGFEEANETNHTLYVSAHHGKVLSGYELALDVDDPDEHHTFHHEFAYAPLGNTSPEDRDQWEQKIPAEPLCGTNEDKAFAVFVYDSELDLYLEQGEADSLSKDPDDYSKNDTSSSDPKYVAWADVNATDIYTALVHDDTGKVDEYRTAWTTWCYTGSDPGSPEAPDPEPPERFDCACDPESLLE